MLGSVRRFLGATCNSGSMVSDCGLHVDSSHLLTVPAPKSTPPVWRFTRTVCAVRLCTNVCIIPAFAEAQDHDKGKRLGYQGFGAAESRCVRGSSQGFCLDSC